MNTGQYFNLNVYSYSLWSIYSTWNMLSNFMFGIWNLTKTKLPWLPWHSWHHWNIILSLSYTSVTSRHERNSKFTAAVKSEPLCLQVQNNWAELWLLYIHVNHSISQIYTQEIIQRIHFPFLCCITWVLKRNSNALRESGCPSYRAINCRYTNKCLIVRPSYFGYIKVTKHYSVWRIILKFQRSGSFI